MYTKPKKQPKRSQLLLVLLVQMLDLQKRVIEEQIKKHNELLEQWSKQHGVTPETAHKFQLSAEQTIYGTTYRIHKDGNFVSELKIEFDPLVSE